MKNIDTFYKNAKIFLFYFLKPIKKQNYFRFNAISIKKSVSLPP